MREHPCDPCLWSTWQVHRERGARAACCLGPTEQVYEPCEYRAPDVAALKRLSAEGVVQVPIDWRERMRSRMTPGNRPRDREE